MAVGGTLDSARRELALRLRELPESQRRLLIAKLGERRLATERVAPLSYAQQRLWFLEQLGAGNPYYNETSAFRFLFRVDAAALRRSLNHVVRRHEALRTVFEPGEGEPRQRVLRDVELDLPEVDLSGLAPSDREREAVRLAERQGREPFDLATGPLLRVALFRFAERDSVFVLTMHHIVCDGWSMRLFFDELRACYEAEASGREVGLDPLAVQYADFAEWQRRRLAGPLLERELEYWREQLDGVATLELPADRRRPAVPSFAGRRTAVRVSPDAYAALRALGDHEGATPFMALLTAYQVLLHRYTGQDDIAVGSPIANRALPEHEKLIGFLVNTLVLRADLSGEPSFRQALRRVRDVALSAYEHQDLPFEKLVEHLRPERDSARHPIFQATFQMLRGPATPVERADIQSLDVDLHTAKFDLRCDVWETPAGGIDGYLEYSVDLFEGERVAMMARHFETLLCAAAAQPDTAIARLDLLTPADERRIVVELNRTEMELPSSGCVQQAFEACAARTESAPAVGDWCDALTYGELNRRANRLARHLRDRGVIPGSLVAVLLDRSVDYVVAILAACKAGAAWVPLDPTYPAARLAAIIQDAVVHVAVTQDRYAAKVPGGVQRVLIDSGRGAWEGQDATNLPAQVDLQSLAYVVFTSGSTGRPKGVEILHGGLLNLVSWHDEQYAITPRDRATLYASPAFDASVWELWPYLTAGASVWIPEPRVHGAPAELLDWMAREQVTVTFLPTPVAEEVVEAELPPDLRLRVLLTGGDRLRGAPSRRLPFRLVNHYGPTEYTVVATSAEVTGAPGGAAPPIGRPIANTQAYVLDRAMRPVPPGVKGELHLAGHGLARGYLGDAAQTRDRFVPNPFDTRPGSRMYRTGDVVRQRLDGNLEFVGRADRQLKIRGFRIEPADVESVLDEHPSVQKSLVGSYETAAGDSGLVAYVIAAAGEPAAPATDVQAERAREWRELYDWIYGDERADRDPGFDIVGWNSSYTGRPLSEAEMREQVDATVERVCALGGRRVLEIGCGTGLLLFRLAEDCERYRATDFSAAVVGSVRAECLRRGLRHVELSQQEADDFAGVEAGAFDVVVLNSVVQYFPGVEYLERVLAGAMRALRPGGAVFVGDVRRRGLLPWLHAGVTVLTADDAVDAVELGRRVDRAVDREQELVLDPEFFAAWAARSGCDDVQIEIRRGRHRNEITKFRYDVVLGAGRRGDAVSDWEERVWEGLDACERHLREERPAAVCLRRVPSARLAAERRLMRRMGEGDPRATAAVLRREFAAAADGVEPEDLWALERGGGYTVRIVWGEPGCYDVWCVARRRPEESRWEARIPAPAHAPDQPPAAYANDVLEQWRLKLRANDLRQYLAARLPDHMVPAQFVWTDRLGLTPNGKLDRRSLPAVCGDEGRATTYVSPRGDLEERIASVWSEVLGLDHVGADANFFDLGGHSLLLVKVHSRLKELKAAELSVVDLFRYPTVRSLALAITGA